MPRVTDGAGDPLAALDADTRLLYERVLAEPRNAELRRIIEAPSTGAPPGALRLVLVPGLFYREFPETGADGAFLKSVARTLGLSVETQSATG